MNLSYFIARKYFLSGKKKNFINVISIISMLVVGISTMALIIVVSVFNGLEDLLRTTYGSFDPDIIVTPAEGKSFELTDDFENKIEAMSGITLISHVIEDNVAVKYRNVERVVRMKGVSSEAMSKGRLRDKVISGNPTLLDGDIPYAIVGLGIRWELGVDLSSDYTAMQVYYPKNLRPGVSNPASMVNIQNIVPAGIFAIEKYYDDNYIFVPVEFAERLMSYQNRRTGIEIDLENEINPEEFRTNLSSVLGDDFRVLSGDELHSDLYNILRIEKLFVYIIFGLIIGIASINIYFVLTMLSIDKKKDLAILSAQGASQKLIRNIFIKEGAIIAMTGGLAGTVIGLVISLLQQEFGLVSMGMQSTLADAYPVKVETPDVLITVLCVGIITLIASIPPASLASKKLSMENL